jgi:hypothetical protein
MGLAYLATQNNLFEYVSFIWKHSHYLSKLLSDSDSWLPYLYPNQRYCSLFECAGERAFEKLQRDSDFKKREKREIYAFRCIVVVGIG